VDRQIDRETPFCILYSLGRKRVKEGERTSKINKIKIKEDEELSNIQLFVDETQNTSMRKQQTSLKDPLIYFIQITTPSSDSFLSRCLASHIQP
jgi:hypothetical protein